MTQTAQTSATPRRHSLPAAEGGAGERSFWLVVAAAAVVGIVGIVWSASHQPPFDDETLAEVVHGLSEALFIAAFIAAVVDPFAKRRFAGDVGRGVLLALFGRNAPQAYIDGLHQALRPDRVTHGVEWLLDLSWHTTDVIRVEVAVLSLVQNVSDGPIKPTPAWLPASVAGAPEPRFLEYRLDVAAEGEGSNTRSLSTSDLDDAQRLRRSGSVVLDVDAALQWYRVPPGATQRLSLRGVTYESVPAVVPLVLSNPALRQRLVVTGSAVKDLDLDVYLGAEELVPVRSRGGDASLAYDISDLALPGATWRIHWQRRRSRGALGVS